MTWRGSTTVKDRILACLPYLLPLIHVVNFGEPLLKNFPALETVFTPLFVVSAIYAGITRLFPFGLGGLIIFFALFMLVVRNERVPHFIRFNTMQAILLDVVIILCAILLDLIRFTGNGFAMQTLATTIFLGIVVASAYSVIQSLLGRYAEIPAISDAVYMQVR
jgi:uncharacterized membrane protein